MRPCIKIVHVLPYFNLLQYVTLPAQRNNNFGGYRVCSRNYFHISYVVLCCAVLGSVERGHGGDESESRERGRQGEGARDPAGGLHRCVKTKAPLAGGWRRWRNWREWRRWTDKWKRRRQRPENCLYITWQESRKQQQHEGRRQWRQRRR